MALNGRSRSPLVPHSIGLHHGTATIERPYGNSDHRGPLLEGGVFCTPAAETGELLVSQVFCLHGLPNDKVSDQGPQFTSRV